MNMANGKYEKFMVYAMKGDSGSSIPWTGIDCTIAHVKELLEAGFTVQIHPYTREEWAKRAK